MDDILRPIAMLVETSGEENTAAVWLFRISGVLFMIAGTVLLSATDISRVVAGGLSLAGILLFIFPDISTVFG